jgi:hypothetical protein
VSDASKATAMKEIRPRLEALLRELNAVALEHDAQVHAEFFESWPERHSRLVLTVLMPEPVRRRPTL